MSNAVSMHSVTKVSPCRLCEMTVEEAVAHYIAAILTFTRAITEEGVTRLQADHNQLVAFFQQHCKPDKLNKLAAPLQHLKDVAAADSADTFVLTYTTLLQVSKIRLNESKTKNIHELLPIVREFFHLLGCSQPASV